MKSKMTVGITTHADRCKWLRDMLNGLYHFTQMEFKVVIVDNFSEDNTLEYLGRLAQIKDITVIKNSENVDDTKGMNQILSIVDTEYLLKIDTDTLFTKEGSVDSIFRQMQQTDASLIGPLWDLSLHRRKEIVGWEHSFGMRSKFDLADKLVQRINPHFEVTLRLPRGNLMLMHVPSVKKVGCFDTRYLHNAMEYSLAMRLLDAGLDYEGFYDDSVIHRPLDDLRLKVRKVLPDLLREEF